MTPDDYAPIPMDAYHSMRLFVAACRYYSREARVHEDADSILDKLAAAIDQLDYDERCARSPGFHESGRLTSLEQLAVAEDDAAERSSERARTVK